MMVFLHHTFLLTFKQVISKETFLNRILETFCYGGTGVSVFFVLSGFLITYLLLNENEKNGSINIPAFYVRRILRIWPLYFVVIIFSVTVFPILKSHIGEAADLAIKPIYYYTFLSNFDAIRIINKLGVIPQMMSGITWSVAIEEQFYLFWPLLFVITPAKQYKYMFFFVILVSIAFRIYNRTNGTILYYHSLSVCCDLAMGGLSAYYSFSSIQFKDFFKKLRTSTIVIIYLFGFLWLLFGDQHISNNLLIAITRLISVVFFAFIILEQNYSDNSFYKFSRSKLLSFWGKYTYGLYMLHSVALWVSTILLAKVFSIANPDLYLPSIFRNIIGFVLSLTISYASYELYEKKFLKYKDKFNFSLKGEPKT